jgi:hypothetical protein
MWGPESISTLICALHKPTNHLTRTFHRCLTLNTNSERHRPMKEYRGQQQYSSTYSAGAVCVASRNFFLRRSKTPAVERCNNCKVVNSTKWQPFYIDRFLSRRSEEYYRYNHHNHNHNHPYFNYNTVGCLVYLIDLVCEYVVSWWSLQQMAVSVMKQARGT